MVSMLVSEVRGDVFALDVSAIAHGVNVDGVMGAGVARGVRDRFPELYAEYRHWCRAGLLQPGGCFPFRTSSGLWVYNLASQDRPGPRARLDWLSSSVSSMVEHAASVGVPVVGAVRIGCGIGGLSWEAVLAVLETIDSPVELLVASP